MNVFANLRRHIPVTINMHLHSTRIRVFLVLLALFFLSSLMIANVPIIFRYDDYCASDDPDRLLVDERILDIHSRYGVPIVLGVIPEQNPSGDYPTAPLIEDEQRMTLLRTIMDQGLVEIALHGYTHENLVSEGRPSEFTGLPRDEQMKRIIQGKKSLEEWLDIEVDVFIPPFNTYDNTTLEILNQEGFRIISAGKSSAPEAVDLISIPYWILLRSIDINLLLKEAEKSESFHPIVFLIHEYDFFESNSRQAVISLDDYEQAVSRVSSSNNLYGTTFSQLADDQRSLERLRSATTRVIVLEYNLRRFVPGFLRDGFHRVFFFLERSIGFSGILFILYIVLFLAGNVVSLLLSKALGRFRSVWTGMSIVLIALSVYLVIDLGAFDISLLAGSARYNALSLTLGILTGSIVSWVLFSSSKARKTTEVRH